MATEEAADKNTKKGKGHKKGLISLVILVVILGAAVYLYETYGSLPTQLLSIVSSGKQLNATELKGLLLQKIDSMNNFAVNYTGQIIINKDPAVSVSFAKYYNNTRVWLSVGDLMQFGNLSAIFTSKNTSQYGLLCLKASYLPIFNLINSSNMTNGYKCVQTYNSSAQAQLSRIADIFVNVSSMSNVATRSYGVQLYNGQPCYSVSGSAMIEVNSTLVDVNSSTQTPVNVDFSACFSAQYNIPLTVSANLTAANGSSIRITLNESSLSQTTTASQVS